MLKHLTEDESGDAARDSLEALLITSQAESEALKPLTERLKGAEQRVRNKAKQLEKATANGVELAEQTRENDDNVRICH